MRVNLERIDRREVRIEALVALLSGFGLTKLAHILDLGDGVASLAVACALALLLFNHAHRHGWLAKPEQDPAARR